MNVQPPLLSDLDQVILPHPVAPLVDLHHLGVDLPQGAHQWEMVHQGIHQGGHHEDHLGKDQEGHHLHSDVKCKHNQKDIV